MKQRPSSGTNLRGFPLSRAARGGLELGVADVASMMLILSIALLVLFAGSSVLFGDEEAVSALEGRWQLDTEMSDDPVEKMRESMEGRSRVGAGSWSGGSGVNGVGGGVGRGGGGIGMGGRGRGRADDDAGGRVREEAEDRLREQTARLETVEIRQQADGTLTFTFADGSSETFTTNGKKNRVARFGREVEVQAKWKKQSLVVTTRSPEGLMIETYQLAGGGELLKVKVEAGMSGGGARGPVVFQRLFRPLASP